MGSLRHSDRPVVPRLAIVVALILSSVLLATSGVTLLTQQTIGTTASPTSFSVQVPIQVTDPLQSVPVALQLQRVDIAPPGMYDWHATSNLGYAQPNRGSGPLPISEASFTYFPGSTPIDYRTAYVSFTITYSPHEGSSLTHKYTITFPPTYQVSVLSNRGIPSGSGFYAGGTWIKPTVTPTEILEGDSTKHQLKGWQVEVAGRPLFTIGLSDILQITQVTSITAAWTTSHLVRFTGPGNSTESWLLKGSSVTFTSPTCIEEGQGKRRALDGYDVNGVFVAGGACSTSVSSPLSVTAIYHDEFYLHAVSERGVASGSGWYPRGASVTPSMSPTIVNDTTVSRWVFAGWNATLPVLVAGPLTLVASWTREYRVSVSTYSGGRVVDGWYASGTRVRITGSQPHDLGNKTMSIFSGWSDGNPDINRELTVAAPLSIHECRALYYFVSVTPPDPLASVTGDCCQAGWVRAGTWVRVTVPKEVNQSEGVKLVFTGFTNPITTGDAEISFLVEGPVDVVAQWTRFFLITADGGHSEVKGSGWYREGAEVDLEVLHEVVYDTASSRWVFEGWDPGVPILANDTATVKAKWRREYFVSVTSPFGQASGSGWYREGDTVRLSVEPHELTLTNGSRATFSYWRVDGSGVSGNTLIVNGTEQCIAVWALASLPNTGAPDTNPPHPNTNSSDTNTLDTNSSDTNVDTSPDNSNAQDKDPQDHQGDLPSPGSSEATNNTTDHGDTQQAETNPTPKIFALVLVTNCSSCTGAGTYSEGSVVTIGLATPVVPVSPSERLRFVGWANESSTMLSNLPTFNLTLNRNMTIRAVWRREVNVGERWLWEDEPVALAARPNVLSEDGKTMERFQSWILENGSEICTSEIVLPARDAVRCSERRCTYYVATFRVYGVDAVQVTIIAGSYQHTDNVRDGASLWFRSGSTIFVDIPMMLDGTGLQYAGANADHTSLTSLCSPIEVTISYPSTVSVRCISSAAETNPQMFLVPVSIWIPALVLVVLMVTAWKVMGMGQLVHKGIAPKGARGKWFSVEGYLRQAERQKEKNERWTLLRLLRHLRDQIR